ncbi:class D sortase [Butyrivibrio sp. AE2032]|uniref:class D sortase n=1 Tax=Butyrivibrio sp. AE2032 TaxID=1458463 RepID=UPI00054FEFAD|nr:class D sortase [Butyrivibrio sp. AE2032]
MNKHFTLKIFEKSGRIMKEKYYGSKERSRSKAVSTGLIILSVVFLITGIILLLIEPIKRLNRQRISGEALNVIEQKIFESGADEAEMTFVVPATGNEVSGEEYDFIEEPEETEEEEEGSGGYVTLNSIGILSISRINIKYSVWDEATKVSLRYGLGHYPDSVMPGEIGNATILGHNYKDGSMFHRLSELKIGDKVVFKGTDGVEKVFYVEESKIVSADDLVDMAVGNITDTRQLTLVTCTYEYGRHGWRRVVICRMEPDPEPEETTAAYTEPYTEETSGQTEETAGETSETVETTAETASETVLETTAESTEETPAPSVEETSEEA